MASSVAFGLPWDKPAEADGSSAFSRRKGTALVSPVIAWKIATLDPARARKLVESSAASAIIFQHEFCVALGAKGRDEPTMRAAIRGGSARARSCAWTKNRICSCNTAGRLAIAEAIDPGLVAEVMWRLVACRPASGNPRMIEAYPPVPCRAHRLVRPRACRRLSTPTLARMAKLRDAELDGLGLGNSRPGRCRPPRRGRPARKNSDEEHQPERQPAVDLRRRKASPGPRRAWRKSFTRWAPIFNPLVRDWMLDRF